MVIKKCIECNNNFISKPSAKRRFCSRFCYGKQVSNRQKGDNNPKEKLSLGNTKRTSDK